MLTMPKRQFISAWVVTFNSQDLKKSASSSLLQIFLEKEWTQAQRSSSLRGGPETGRHIFCQQSDSWPANARDMAPQQSDRLEAAAYALLEEAIARRSSEYPSSLKEDRAAVAQGSLSERQTLALQLRVSELELLELTGNHAAEQRALIQGE
eukprot:TRINITY_DN10418_c0_g2_i1.p2 TRINITY_DN10418_c0_g2~~TRINITY_DN10418_c0_g2_i1.p2  ORF type:complete len:152 (-),score=32.04 TRINITY_DN10418_c0_g2_i1:46-501(-)